MLKLQYSGHLCEDMTHCKRPWCSEKLKAWEGDERGLDGWMASLTLWTWVWVGSGNWWWTGRPGVLQFMGLQRVLHDLATELNWIVVLGKKKKKEYFKYDEGLHKIMYKKWRKSNKINKIIKFLKKITLKHKIFTY